MSAALGAGLLPSHFEFYDEDKNRMASADDMGDVVAKIVLQRFRDARQWKASNQIYQGKTVRTLLREADYAMEKRFTPETTAALTEAFGICPTRYYGLSAAKTVEIADWKAELVAGDPGSLVKIIPTPNPRLPRSSVEAIKESVKQELVERMMNAGIGDPSMLVTVGSNRLHNSVKTFLDSKAKALRDIERVKITSAATAAAERIQVLMRDTVIEGGFRETYATFSRDQIKYGVGIMRFPYWKRRIILADDQDFKGRAKRKWRVEPTFSSVSPWNFFPTMDGRDLEDNSGNSEYREINKITLVGLMKDKRYDAKAIEFILENYTSKSRGWLFPEVSDSKSEDGQSATYWGPEELVGVIYHEGFVTGRDLHNHGLTGYEDTEVYDIIAEVCCGRAIRVEVVDPLATNSRSYAASKYDDLGQGIWRAAGVPAILHDTEQRINLMWYCAENNLDWSLRPPLQTNSEALKNPNDARNIVPGGKYEISDMLGSGQVPDPIRTIRGPTAQYQLVIPLIQGLIRQADQEVGVPSLSDMSSFGRGSLGELSARISGAVRRVRSAAFSEDRSMKPIWRVLFEHVIDENPKAAEDADLELNYQGVVGLLAAEAERKAKIERLGLIMQGTQAGIAPPEVAKYAFEDLFKDMGVPTEALGFSSPLTDNAIAIATASGMTASAGTTNLAGPPQLDGRSGSIAGVPSAIAAPNGASQMSMPPGA